MTNEITPAPAENSALTMPTKKNIPGMGQFDAEELQVPYIRLIQPTSKTENGQPGEFINSSTNQAMRSVDMVFICFGKSMVSFKDPKTGVEKKPQRQYKLLGINQVTKFPAIFAVSSISSIIEVKKLLNAFWQEGRPLWSKVIRMTSQKMNGDYGVYYKVNFELLADTSEEAQKEYAAFYGSNAENILGGEAEGTGGVVIEDVAV